MRLDFVAVALGLPGDTLPRLVAAAEEEFRERERARLQPSKLYQTRKEQESHV